MYGIDLRGLFTFLAVFAAIGLATTVYGIVKLILWVIAHVRVV